MADRWEVWGTQDDPARVIFHLHGAVVRVDGQKARFAEEMHKACVALIREPRDLQTAIDLARAALAKADGSSNG